MIIKGEAGYMIDKDRKLKLELVRITGVCNLLQAKCNSGLLKLRAENLLDIAEIKDIGKSLSRMSSKQLINLIKQSNEIANEDIDIIYELNRYI